MPLVYGKVTTMCGRYTGMVASGSCWRRDRSCWYVRECRSAQVSRKGRRFRQLQTVPIGLKPCGW